ncbi:MAG: acylphosphatase [Flavobacteriales bacterium]|nr:MAG: acylphosphatase [Flavobacteriales bacterium]
MNEIKHYNIKIKGKVQGVWFRFSSKEIAEQLGVSGFVQNELDDSVYIEAEGTEEQLKMFIKWCENGPEMAIVTNAEIMEGKVKNFTSFKIERRV